MPASAGGGRKSSDVGLVKIRLAERIPPRNATANFWIDELSVSLVSFGDAAGLLLILRWEGRCLSCRENVTTDCCENCPEKNFMPALGWVDPAMMVDKIHSDAWEALKYFMV